MRLRNRFGANQHDSSLEFGTAAGDTTGGFGKVIVLPFTMRPGTYQMQVRMEDLRSRKRGLAYVGRKVTKTTNMGDR